jgi:hypothetical protein
MNILVVDKGFESPLGRGFVPDNLLRGRKILKGYAQDLSSDGHKVTVTCSYSHALEELTLNMFGFDLIVINYDEVDGGGLKDSAIAQAIASSTMSFYYAKMLIQMSQGKLAPKRNHPRFIALTPLSSPTVRRIFEEAGFEVFIIPSNFTAFKKGLRRVVNNGHKKVKNGIKAQQAA